MDTTVSDFPEGSSSASVADKDESLPKTKSIPDWVSKADAIAALTWKWLRVAAIVIGVITVLLLLPLGMGVGLGIHTQPWLGLIIGFASLIFGAICLLNFRAELWTTDEDVRVGESVFGMIFLIMGSGILLKVIEHSEKINAFVMKILGLFIR